MDNHNPKEMFELYWQDRNREFFKHISAATTDEEMRAAIQREKELAPARRRHFFCTHTEDIYRQYLAAAKDGPNKEEARTTLATMIDGNLRWSRNNIASFGLQSTEYPMFRRIEELSLEYQAALKDLTEPKPKATIETVAEKVDALHATAGAIHADTQQLKVSVPAVIEGQAKTIRDHEKELDRLKVILSQRIAELFIAYQEIEPADMKIFLSFLREGNQVKAAAALGMKEQTLRARVAKWPFRGAAYARIYDIYKRYKETPQKPKLAPNYDKLLFENQSGSDPDPDVDAHIFFDIAEIIVDMTPANCEVKKKILLTKYLAEYTST